MEIEKVIETYGIDREDLEGNDWYIVEKAEHIQHEVIGDLCIKTKDYAYKAIYDNCYAFEGLMHAYYFKPKHQEDYIVISNQKNYLEARVRIKLQEGYEPVGSLHMIETTSLCGEKYILFSQAMYRKGDENDMEI